MLAVDAVGDLVIDSSSIARYFQIRVFICIHICLIADRCLTDIDLVEVKILDSLYLERNVVVPRACLPGALDGRAQCNRTQRFVIFKIAVIRIVGRDCYRLAVLHVAVVDPAFAHQDAVTLTGCICDNSGIVAALVNGGLVVGHIIGVRGLQDNVLIAVAVLVVPWQAFNNKLFKIAFCDLVGDVVGFFANCQNRLCCVIDSFPITRLVSRIRFSIQGHRTDIGIDLALTLLVEGKLNSLSWFHFPNLVDGVGDLILNAVDNFACPVR